MRLHLGLEPVERFRLADRDELRRRLFQPREQISDLMHGYALERCVAIGLRCRARDVELIVDVAIHGETLLLEAGNRLTRQSEWDRLVPQEAAAVRIGDDRALVADDRLRQLGLG